MPRLILPGLSRPYRVALLALLAWLGCGSAWGHAAEARVERIETDAATLSGVRVRLDWPGAADRGRLRIQAASLDAAMGYSLQQLDWRCDLRTDPGGRWQCEGPVEANGVQMGLAVAMQGDDLHALLEGRGARVALDRDAATPDTWAVELAGVPLAWLQQLLAQAWPEGRLTAGTVAGKLDVHAATDGPLRVAGPVTLDDAGFDSADGRFAGEGLDARLAVDATLGDQPAFSVDGRLSGGGLLLGPAYLDLGGRDIGLGVEAAAGDAGWVLPAWHWRDPGILAMAGEARLGGPGRAGTVASGFSVEFDVRSMESLGRHYLDGLFALAGMPGTRLAGAAHGSIALAGGGLEQARVRLDRMDVVDGRGRFALHAVDGDLRFSSGVPVQGALSWGGARLHTVVLGPARLPLHSAHGELRLAAPASLDVLGGHARLDAFRVRPPRGLTPVELGFGLTLEGLDVGALATAMDWPAFTGRLSGTIPDARYAAGRLELAGGLEMSLFDGRVLTSGLSMERPFGVAPTLNADVWLEDIDLAALTGVFEIGGMTGRLDGRISGLRLLDWQPVAFDAWLGTDPSHGGRQRISQRAVQDISSVGDGSLADSLQGRLIGLFDDFGYSRIGIGCVLREQVCSMRGLRPAANDGFVIVDGSGLPHLSVVGYNRRVDWPTLVERLAGLGKGDVKPVVE